MIELLYWVFIFLAGLSNSLSRLIVYCFPLCILFSVDRPIPFFLGFVFSICFSNQLRAFKFVESYSILLFHILVGLLFVLGFDFIRLSPRDFQLFLFSKRDILIIVWALSGTMLVSKLDVFRSNISLDNFFWWTLGSISLLLTINLPILREINSRVGEVHFLQKPQVEFILLAFVIAIVSLRFASDCYSLPIFAWQLTSCWMSLCDSRFFSAISLVNLLLFISFLFSVPKFFKIFAYGIHLSLLGLFSLIFPLSPFFTPWIQKFHLLASLLYRTTATRIFDTWSLNLWHKDVLDLANHWPQWIPLNTDLVVFSQEYRASVLNTSTSPYFYLNHAHSLSLQQLLLFDPSAGSLADILVASLPLFFILFVILIALRIRLNDQYLPYRLGLVYGSTVLLIVGYITTESVAIVNVLPLIVVLPVIQSFGSQPLCIAPFKDQGLALSISPQSLYFVLRTPLSLFLAVAMPVIVYYLLYLS